ncbi:hypothetical protein HS1genome_1771 [Sulfodiicoccus acidiphilus]|uniref:Uncharacterized protein n=1 Tax=Sulfodiicoccus acidiphilus TaxID=1670455 RepID=A0A348B5D0_9CREN|nr:hypothetical protein [Sulfodiicoccus acidiphilus]BBD73382.1 hypothetical protein HS1genome_1771 [Sulfodiicoccus acidiphilus]GGT98916.1 hypothetical protein GCM10007116_15420 [Sulfodiicoccus acidiphilus]
MIAMIHGYETNPKEISNANDFKRFKLDDVGTATGVFVIKKDLCPSLEEEFSGTH